jgi:adenylosuccinate lyase
MYRKTGRKHEAHTILSQCAHESRTSRRPLREVILEQEGLRQLFSDDELDSLLDLTDYLGTAAMQVDLVLDRLLPLNAKDRDHYSIRRI